ncbi:MAG TPA: hypothetical protein VKB78_06855, partial [Pirellulales bacterium]|nr:hypothetical protein [Pirellulales bacterium]
TWGQLKRMTWAFYDAYVDEAYAILAQDFLSDVGKAPNGFDIAALAADLEQVGQMQSPPMPLPPAPNPPPPAPPAPTPPPGPPVTLPPIQPTSRLGHLFWAENAFGWYTKG